MAKISITRALATLKSIDAKIVKQTERLDTALSIKACFGLQTIAEGER